MFPRSLGPVTWSWRYGIEPLDLNEAIQRIRAAIAPRLQSEHVTLEHADARIAAQDVQAPVDLPPFACSAMDGIAVRHAALHGKGPHQLQIVGESRAGHPFTGAALAPGDCIRIFTGAPLPPDLDTVIIQEDCDFQHASAARVPATRVTTNAAPFKGENVREVGQDVPRGARVVTRGDQLNPFTLGWLAACGITELAVFERPRVSVFSTGDELAEPGTPLGPGQIYDANRVLLKRMLARLPTRVEDVGIIPDDPDRIRRALVDASRRSQMLVTSAGVSVGDADFVTTILREIGHLDLWRLRIKPGKPLAFGRVNDAYMFGLPGNPVSTVVTFLTIVRPALLKLCGATHQTTPHHLATLAEPLAHRPGREEFQRGVLSLSDAGPSVRVTGDQSSNRLGSFQGANCLIRVPSSAGNLEPGETVAVLPFYGLL